jgi:hypothetical protein
MASAAASLAIGALARPGLAQQPRTLIKGGVVLSFDRNIGDFENADVLIEGGKIAAVRPNISADAAVIDAANTIVLPGFIDTHHHFYQSQLRNVLPNGVLADYFRDISGAATSEYRVEDAYVGNLIGALRSIDAGITTVTDLSQVSNTPEHSDALIKGLKDSGVRAVYAYSRGSGPGAKYPGDAERILKQHFASTDRINKQLPRGGGVRDAKLSWTRPRRSPRAKPTLRTRCARDAGSPRWWMPTTSACSSADECHRWRLFGGTRELRAAPVAFVVAGAEVLM